MDGLSDRKQDPFYVKREDAEWIRHTLLPEWKNRCLEYKIAQETGGEDQKLSSVIKTNQQGRAQGHIIPDIPLWLSKGPCGPFERSKKLSDAGKYDPGANGFLPKCNFVSGRSSALLERYALLAEKKSIKSIDSHEQKEYLE